MAVVHDRDALTTARVIAVGVLTAEVVVLAVTGVWLVFFYRPTSSSAWVSIQHLHTTLHAAAAVRGVHRWTAFLAVPTSVVAGALVVVDARNTRPGWRGRAAVGGGPALVVVVAAAVFTGFLLPWDQLARWAVSVGTNMSGYTPVFGSQVRFVLLNGSVVSKARLWRWFIIHTVVLSILIVLALVIAWGPRRRQSATPQTGPTRPPRSTA